MYTVRRVICNKNIYNTQDDFCPERWFSRFCANAPTSPEQNPRAGADTIPKARSAHFQKFPEPIFRLLP